MHTSQTSKNARTPALAGGKGAPDAIRELIEVQPTAKRTIVGELIQSHPGLSPQLPLLLEATEKLCACHRRGGTVLLCGNGGSASDCSHIAGELMKGFRLPRPIDRDDASCIRAAAGADDIFPTDCLQRGVRAISLPESSALSTAIANDLSHEVLFAQQVFVHGRAGDVLVGLSTSGNSTNVVRALQVARARAVGTIGFTGSAVSRMDPYCDIVFKVPETVTHKVQELHLPLYHALCALVEVELFSRITDGRIGP